MSDATPIPPSFTIETRNTISQLEERVREQIAAGYLPCGGAFNASAFLPPNGGIGLAMIRRDALSSNTPATSLSKPNTP